MIGTLICERELFSGGTIRLFATDGATHEVWITRRGIELFTSFNLDRRPAWDPLEHDYDEPTAP